MLGLKLNHVSKRGHCDLLGYLCPRSVLGLVSGQGWGQFHFFNSIPIPIPLFSIPIPIPLLPISFNSNSNSNSGDFNSNSNSNSGDFKIQPQLQKWPVEVFHEIDYNYNNKVYVAVYKIIVINTISLICPVKWLWLHGIMVDPIPIY